LTIEKSHYSLKWLQLGSEKRGFLRNPLFLTLFEITGKAFLEIPVLLNQYQSGVYLKGG
jgi:hypothetical protein